ncbi:MAG: hypothetical protein M0D55_18830 [Elusimicrobiota bacterium]|nr:MAG: hypothetical protein M0D55_18830 [Elusimicrobiota bacterium]
MDQAKTGGPSGRTGLYVWFTILYVVLTFTVNPVDTIAQATVGKLFAYLLGPLFGHANSPKTWTPSLLIELKALINAGFLVGIAIGYQDIPDFKHLHRSVFPGAVLLAPLVLVMFIPQGVWLALPAGSIIIGTVPYLLLGGTVGCLVKRTELSALTKRLTGRRPGEE